MLVNVPAAAGLPSGLVDVYGEEIVPSSVHVLNAIPAGRDPADEESYSERLSIPTSRWGDVTEPHQRPGAVYPTDCPAWLQPDFFDARAVIDKWQDTNIATRFQDLSYMIDETTEGIAFIFRAVGKEGHVLRPFVGFYDEKPMKVVDVEARFAFDVVVQLDAALREPRPAQCKRKRNDKADS